MFVWHTTGVESVDYEKDSTLKGSATIALASALLFRYCFAIVSPRTLSDSHVVSGGRKKGVMSDTSLKDAVPFFAMLFPT
jgi:hypothetical protein